jgi:phosphatidylserine/phosphatidylglycerophosphate/cardiolipin synthase-like enzyme
VDPVETRFAGPWLIPDRDYLLLVRRLFAAAERRCLVSLFLVSAPSRDREFFTGGLLLELAEVSRRGVDARVLVGGAQESTMMLQLADAARTRARLLDVPCRWLTDIPRVAGHSTVVISDDDVVVGSQPWSGTGRDGQTDNVYVTSGSLARVLDKRFRQQWTQASAS